VSRFKRYLFIFLAWLFLVLAFIGMFLPILPTTPFVLLSAYLFSKSSHKLHTWIKSNKIFGPLIERWEKHGVISIRAKTLSTTMMILLFSYTVIFVPVAAAIKIIIVTIGIAVLTFIWTRPSYPKG